VRRKPGFTLIEMILVLAILVVAAAAVAPSLRGVMRNNSLRAAADKVRTEWTRAHVKAMKTGRIQVFRYELGGTKYKTEPWVTGDDSLEGAPSTGSGFGAGAAVAELPDERDLPEGAKFFGGDLTTDSRAQAVEQELAAAGNSEAKWSRPVLFYSDGSSSDAFVVVGNDHEAGIRVDLRGLTGVVKVGEISSLKALEQQQQ
jgi:prepilin-type N-terminal cleavage/methylation domain-containing protein